MTYDARTAHITSAALGNDGYIDRHYPTNVRMAIANPHYALPALWKYECEQANGLMDFIELVWPVVEPSRRMIMGYVLQVLCEHLEAVSAGQIKKLLINVPPGFMKSLLTAAIFPAWEWGPQNKPHLRYICTSYAEKLSIRDNRRCRMIIDSKEYQQLWGDRFSIVADQDSKIKFENDKRGWKFATSTGGVATGERGDRVIVDDPHNIMTAESTKTRDNTIQYVFEVLPTRVNDPDEAVFIIIMQRSHEGDVSGHILSNEIGYEHLCLPMEYEADHPHKSRTSLGFTDWRKKDGELLWPERFSKEYLENDLKPVMRSYGGSYAVAGQLQQRPTSRGGGMFKRMWWRFYETSSSGIRSRPSHTTDEEPVKLPTRFDKTVISVDAKFSDSQTGSHVSILVIGVLGAQRYVLENITKHMSFKETCDAIAVLDENKRRVVGGLAHRYPTAVKLIENKANGPAIIQTLRAIVPNIIAVNPQGGKIARASAMEPSVEAGDWFLPDGVPWVFDWVDRFGGFPNAIYDDEVDAASQVQTYLLGSQAATRAKALANV